uniref:T-cell receptor alpha/delta variable 19.0 n=1 Tax=Sinocyclocheilus grahami TaxID=75366 RepID=A0A672PZX7_SINGR
HFTLKYTEVHEGANITLSCSYLTAISLHWYRQYPRSAPEYLLLILQISGRVQSTENLDSRFSARLNEKKNRVDLIISSVKVTDSALYYCALEPTVTGNLYTLCKNLPIKNMFSWTPTM